MLSTLVFENLAYFYQVVGLVVQPSSVIVHYLSPILVVMNLNFDVSGSGDSTFKGLCLLPDMSALTKLLMTGLYPVGALVLLAMPCCYVVHSL